jgi:cell division protein FtsI (penicillin-binding protein 3)
LQYLLHSELSKAMKEFKAIGAAGVIAHVPTGEIHAFSSLPSFDPHEPAKASRDELFNRVSLGAYEMGSTFKTFTAAMALDYGEVKFNEGFDAKKPIKVARYTIRDFHAKKRWLSVPEIIAYSSNIGTVKMAMEVGAERQQEFLGKLGMLEPLPIELPERASPLVPSPWREINMMTISYGHGISVSPLHLVQGMQAIVNDGIKQQLTLIKGKKGPATQVISEETSQQVRRLLRTVVQYGSATSADVKGYRVGGKTGTAEKVSAGGGYNRKAKLASFIGTFPVDRPEYIVLVMLDEPEGNRSTYGYATGGWVSAPVVGRVISQMGPLVGIEPHYDIVPDALDAYMQEVERRERKGLSFGGLHAARF